MERYVERRRHFKTPPVDTRQSQEVRRTQALEEQKRRRAQQIDTSRQLDQFSGLNIGDSDDDNDDEEPSDKSKQTMGGVVQFASLLQPADAEPPPDSRSPSPVVEEEMGHGKPKKKKKRKGRGKKKPSKWANKCMYAELLEMREDTLWTESFDIGAASIHDGLPDDLETAWVGLAPVPVGKRCLAVTMQSAGLSGVIPNTVLRSRLLGKVILGPFPSPLPPNTILDCILDENWRTNGILHVLDVVRWKSQDVAGCEASFRFWWRDTRLAEVSTWPPPAPHKSSFASANSPSQTPEPRYRFPYPTSLVPVPYISPLPFEVVLNELLRRARQDRVISMSLPVLIDAAASRGEMEIDSSPELSGLHTRYRLQEVQVPICSDGLLLYVGEASYESGESPLSVWAPRIVHDDSGTKTGVDTGAAQEERPGMSVGCKESPLDVFERSGSSCITCAPTDSEVTFSPDLYVVG
ncbi:hypothetical protein ACEPAI_703 [Sanghuangporus weigelae]